MKRFLAVWLVIICAAGLMAADFTAIFDSSDGSSGYSWKDSGNAEVGRLDSDGNLTVLGKISGQAVAARWSADNTNSPGIVRFTWGTEQFNTAPTVITRTDTNNRITVTQPGIYLICGQVLLANLDADERGDIEVRVDGVTKIQQLGVGHSTSNNYSFPFSLIGSLSANSYIEVYNMSTGATCYGEASYSSLSITKLN
ncbi:MAG: hypothetical protein PHQ23_05865 [Candidatus Wallbacteria bacterium]|nr:hypothetical protein [Candidatus Wallbacteria bacterium]